VRNRRGGLEGSTTLRCHVYREEAIRRYLCRRCAQQQLDEAERRVGVLSLPSAWRVVHQGLNPTNRREFADAAYEIIYSDYTAIGAIAREARLDKPTIRMLVEEAAERAWREDWQQYDNCQSGRTGRGEPASPETRSTGPQSLPLSPETARNPDKRPTETNTLPTDNPDICRGCGGSLTGKRKGARFHNDACRKRAKRAEIRALPDSPALPKDRNQPGLGKDLREGAAVGRACACPFPTLVREMDGEDEMTVCMKCGCPPGDFRVAA
jgi:hypothetical protein